jgi:hypothetical protein
MKGFLIPVSLVRVQSGAPVKSKVSYTTLTSLFYTVRMVWVD